MLSFDFVFHIQKKKRVSSILKFSSKNIQKKESFPNTIPNTFPNTILNTMSSNDPPPNWQEYVAKMESEKEEQAKQMEYLQTQLQDLSLRLRRQREGSSSSGRSDRSGEDSDETIVSPIRRRGHKSRPNNDIKVDIPEYDGRLDADEFVEWLRTVERVFDYKQTPDNKKVKIVALKLRKYASTWWASVCAKRARQDKDKIRSWNKMKKLLKEKFLPSYYVQENFLKFHKLEQGSKSVEEYARDFESYAMRCGVQEDEPQTLVRFLGGLDPEIAQVCELQSYSTLEELIQLAHKVEIRGKGKRKSSSSRVTTTNTSYPKTPYSFPKQSTPTKEFKTPPPQNTNASNTRLDARRCFRCQGFGHLIADCPNKKVVTFVECENFDDDVEEEEEVEGSHEEEVNDEHVISPDEGEVLVVRRALSAKVDDQELVQREAIFHTRCTIESKVCTIIIDGGSCANVASQVLVDKLSLKTKPLANPYVIRWLSQGKGIQVNHKVLLSFSIGKTYNDEVWCDVIPMDACHILLGRPWLYDRRVMHDGYKNTYSLTKDGKKITLKPITISKVPTHKTQAPQNDKLELCLLRTFENNPPPIVIHKNVHPISIFKSQSYNHVKPLDEWNGQVEKIEYYIVHGNGKIFLDQPLVKKLICFIFKFLIMLMMFIVVMVCVWSLIELSKFEDKLFQEGENVVVSPSLCP